MAQIDLQAGDGFRVTLRPVDGGRNIKLLMQGDVPAIGTEVNVKGKLHHITKIQPERVIAVIKRP